MEDNKNMQEEFENNFLQTPSSIQPQYANANLMTPLLGIEQTPNQAPMNASNGFGGGTILNHLTLPPPAQKPTEEQQVKQEQQEDQTKIEPDQENQKIEEEQEEDPKKSPQQSTTQQQQSNQQSQQQNLNNSNNTTNNNSNNTSSNNNNKPNISTNQQQQSSQISSQNSNTVKNNSSVQNNNQNSKNSTSVSSNYTAVMQQSQKIDIETLLNPPNKDFVIKHLDNYLQQGKIFIIQQEFGQALKIYEIIVENCPHQSNSWVLCGRAAYMQKEYMKAILAYQQALQKNTMAQNDAKVWFDYAVCLFKLENYSTAETAFNKVISIEHNFQPLKGQIIVYLAIIKKLNYNYRACLDLLIKSLKEEGFTLPQTVAILCNIGYCLEMLKEPDEALGIYKKAFELNSNSFLALKCYAWHYFQNQQYRETLEIIWKMEETQFEQCFDCLFMTAKCFEAQHCYKEAMNYYHKAVNLNPQHATALCCLGMSFYKFQMFKEAFQCFQRAYQNDPSLLDSLFNIALLYEYSKNYSEAINIYVKLLQINPEDYIVIKRKIAIEKGSFDQLNDFPLREPPFRIKVQLWLENQHSTYIPNHQPSMYQNIKRQFKEKKPNDQVAMFINGTDYQDDDHNIHNRRTHPLIATTPLLQGQSYPSLLQQSPMPRWNLSGNEDDPSPSPYILDGGNTYGSYFEAESPYRGAFSLRKDSTSRPNQFRKASTFLQPSTPHMIGKIGTPSLGPMSNMDFANTPKLTGLTNNFMNPGFNLDNSSTYDKNLVQTPILQSLKQKSQAIQQNNQPETQKKVQVLQNNNSTTSTKEENKESNTNGENDK